MAGASVEQSNARLFNVVERLEKRILELEQATRAPLAETTVSPPVTDRMARRRIPSDRDECVASLLAEGQSLLNANEPEKALECFDQALALDPKHAETLIKKGGALEKLDRFEEAIACYDDAIAADGSMTIAYLHKGGLFNRMSRYEEALQCYEHALHTHEKKAPDEKAAVVVSVEFQAVARRSTSSWRRIISILSFNSSRFSSFSTVSSFSSS